MLLFTNFQEVQKQLFATKNKYGFDSWILTSFKHTSDQEYSRLLHAGRDRLGYQPLLLSFADPIERKYVEVIVQNVTDMSALDIKKFLTDHYHEQFMHRIGLFFPNKNKVDAIYPHFTDYEKEWVQKDEKYRLHLNIPVLVDHVSDAQYWAWEQKDYNPAGTQRLIITVFQPRTMRFADILIENVDDAEMSRIKLLLSSRTKLDNERIFA